MSDVACCCVDFYQLPITQFLLGESFHPGGLKLTRQLAQQLLLSRESRVLDVASGRGATSLLLAEHFGCEVVALDLARYDKKIDVKKADRQQANAPEIVDWQLGNDRVQVASRINFVQACADSLPFANNSFDAIICECALCTFDNPEKAVAEMYRVLKPGGRLGISDIYLNRELPEELDTLLGKVLCVSGALSVEGYHSLMKDAGFHRIQSQIVDWAIIEMIDQIGKQIKVLGTLSGEDRIVIPDWLETGVPQLQSIKKFVDSKGLGYLLMIAKKPITPRSLASL